MALVNLIRLLPCTALPVVFLVLFDLLPSPLRSGWRDLSTLLGKIMTSSILNDKERWAEGDAVIDIFESRITLSPTEKHHPTKDQTHELPTPHRSRSLPASYNGRNSLFLFSLSEPVLPDFSLDLSTKENYAVDNMEYFGPFKDIRATLDYNYHGNYLKSRQEFQDKIVEKFFSGTTIHDCGGAEVATWIAFTAGVMGAGKSHTMQQLASRGLFPLESYVVADPDEIRSHFPEYHMYATHIPERAGELTHKEAGYLTEIVTEVAMQRGYNVLVDGSLRDHGWYQAYFECLRDKYTNLRIAILHILADKASVFERAERRGKKTGRVVPLETLEYSFHHVPISVNKLAPLADFFCELDNSPNFNEVQIKTEGITRDSFRNNWAQTCPGPLEPRGKL